MSANVVSIGANIPRPTWYKATAKYAKANLQRSVWQLVNTFVPYIALWYIMVRLVQSRSPYWITLLLAVPTAGFLIRIFIFFHDCTHLSFFNSKRANTILGYILGVLTFTPYEDWRHSHVIHHATAGDLDRRDVGDVWTLTVEEYRAASKWKQLAYRLYRNPLIMFGLGPGYMFLISHRTPSKVARKRERISVHITNLAIVAIVVIASLTIGLRAYVLIQLPTILMAATAGLWLFYVQHQFEDVYWVRGDVWDRIQSAVKGCSYYKLPKILQWFTGNIGLHHIHHLRARIPNYNLQRCYDEIPELQTVKLLTILTSLQSLRINLWDEERQQMVNFRDIKNT